MERNEQRCISGRSARRNVFQEDVLGRLIAGFAVHADRGRLLRHDVKERTRSTGLITCDPHSRDPPADVKRVRIERPRRNHQADKVLARGNREGRECGRSTGKEASPNFRAAWSGRTVPVRSPRAFEPLSLPLSPSLP